MITDRRLLPLTSGNQLSALNEFIARAVSAEVDLIQIRERDLSARELMSVVDDAAEIAKGSKTLVLVNDRPDIAAAGRVGVHLATTSLAPAITRNAFGSDMLLGASTHSLEDAGAAERGGVDFVVFGPVFETESKRSYGPPLGIEALRSVASRLSVPVFALGGINESNLRQALDVGAAGVAGISLFAGTPDLKQLVRMVKQTQ